MQLKGNGTLLALGAGNSACRSSDVKYLMDYWWVMALGVVDAKDLTTERNADQVAAGFEQPVKLQPVK